MSVYVQSVVIEACKVCDVGVDPLDVPNESCGHDRYTHATQTHVDFVPKRDYDLLVKLGNNLATAACWPEDQHGISYAVRKWNEAVDD